MPKIDIDGQEFDVKPAQNLLQVSLSHGFDVPYFCWHPDLGSVGACRQCAVRQFAGPDDKIGRIVMACMTSVAEGMRVSIKDQEAVAFRAGVIELLMTNHPHDCPVCEEGGECHLQDMTVMSGHVSRRYRFEKRTHRNQYLGPLIKHEMNRCIACYRCVRFYKDYAGDTDLDAFASRNIVYFGRAEDGVLESAFSGNLTEVCPTGVFTDKTFSNSFRRKWDLRSAASVCGHCSLGCNITVQERDGLARRVINRYNGDVNRYFICDRGRYGYEYLAAPQRLSQPLLRDRHGARSAGKIETLAAAAKWMARGALGIGSPRASLESNFALQRLVGAENFYSGLGDTEAALLAQITLILRDGPVPSATMHEAETAGAVFALGEDPARSAPRLALALRQAARQAGIEAANKFGIPAWHDVAVRDFAGNRPGALFIATPAATALDGVAVLSARLTPPQIVDLGHAVARRISGAFPDEGEPGGQAGTIAAALLAADSPLIVAGCTLGSIAAIEAAANVAWALHRSGKSPRLSFVVPECNSLGLSLLGGRPFSEAASRLASEPIKTLIVLENDLHRRAPAANIGALYAAAEIVIALDQVNTATTDRADAAFPAAAIAESEGTLVSAEGRAQRFFRAIYRETDAQESWRWLRDLASATGKGNLMPWQHIDDVLTSLAVAHPGLAGAVDAAPAGNYRIAGNRISSEPHRYSGRTAVSAVRGPREPKPPMEADAPVSPTMEGYYGQMPGALLPYAWSPGWNSAQSINKFQDEVGGPLRGGNPGVRLFDLSSENAPTDFKMRPAVPAGNGLVAVAIPSVFGSDELTAFAPALAGRADQASVYLNTEDAATRSVRFNSDVEVTIGTYSARFRARLEETMPAGVIGLSTGFAGFPTLDLTEDVVLRPVAEGESG